MSLQLGFNWLEQARQERRKGTRGLLVDVPRARRNDPKPSHVAAERVRKSGQLRESQQLVLDAIRARPGHTAAEIGDLMAGTVCRGIARPASWWRFEVSRRAAELRGVHVDRDAPRRCNVNGTLQTTWVPHEAP